MQAGIRGALRVACRGDSEQIRGPNTPRPCENKKASVHVYPPFVSKDQGMQEEEIVRLLTLARSAEYVAVVLFILEQP